MSIMQVGSKLVRTFGSGQKAKHVITETLGNKTFTEVVDSEGNCLKNRVKEITRQNVGDKLVITRKEDGIQKDLVYDKDGKFLGMRILDDFNYFGGKPAKVLKVNADGIGRWKACNLRREDVDGVKVTNCSRFGELIINPRKIKSLPLYPDSAEKLFKEGSIMTRYNKFGLPMPHTWYRNLGEIDIHRPLREMIGTNTKAFPVGSGYEFLNYVKPKFDIVDYAKNLKWKE